MVNAPLEDRADLEELLEDDDWLLPSLADRDLPALRRVQRQLHAVFEASARGDEHEVVRRLNELFAKHPVTPYIAGHDAQSWHLHVTDRASSVAELVTAEALVGLAAVVCELGATRLGLCQAQPCTGVFVDTSPNRSRRYCSERCSSRANVAAYRARQKASAS